MVPDLFKVEKAKLSDLKPWEDNPRKVSPGQMKILMNSLSEFGLVDAFVCDHDLTIIGGHQRRDALMKLGEKDIDVFVMRAKQPLTQEQILELNVRLNRNTGYFIDDMVNNMLSPDELISLGYDKRKIQFKNSMPPDPNKKGEEGEETEEDLIVVFDMYISEEHNAKLNTILDAISTDKQLAFIDFIKQVA